MKNANFTLSFFMGLVMLCFCAQGQTLNPIPDFGTNPGTINAYDYIPDSMPANAPLVLVLHGCTETATTFNMDAQWSTLADQHKFYVAYGEQTSANNIGKCWNIYQSNDNSRDSGEALSLKQLTDYMKAHYSIDSTRVFVTGFSAGGAMTAVMAACYPEVYAAAAEMSGLPYGCATNVVDFGEAALGLVSKTPQEWGDLARAQNPGYTGNWPRMAIFHGSVDEVVDVENATQMIYQWTNLHNISQTPGYTQEIFNGNLLLQSEQFFDSTNRPQVTYYEIALMLHGIAVYPGTCYQQGGGLDASSFNESFYSPFWAAQFFGILHPAPGLARITGPSDVAINKAGLKYSVPKTAGSTYTWTIIPTASGTITKGQGTNSITVTWAAEPGTVYVTEMPTGGCELGPVTLYVKTRTPKAVAGELRSDAVTSVDATVPGDDMLTVYPNPSEGRYFFKGTNAGSTLQIMDISGRQIFSAVVNDNIYQLDLSGKASGIYLYRVIDNENGTQEGKIVLN